MLKILDGESARPLHIRKTQRGILCPNILVNKGKEARHPCHHGSSTLDVLQTNYGTARPLPTL